MAQYKYSWVHCDINCLLFVSRVPSNSAYSGRDLASNKKTRPRDSTT